MGDVNRKQWGKVLGVLAANENVVGPGYGSAYMRIRDNPQARQLSHRWFCDMNDRFLRGEYL